MPLVSVSVREYRSFVERTTLELRPLTLLYGYNSAGKSALLRALPLVSASTDPTLVGPLALDSEATRGASFADIKTRLTDSYQFEVGLAWDDGPEDVRHLSFVLLDLQAPHGQIIAAAEAKKADGSTTFSMEWSTHFGADNSPTYNVQAGETGANDLNVQFTGLLPSDIPEETPPTARRILTAIAQRLIEFRHNLHWLTCVREPPERRVPIRSTRRRELSHIGTDAASYLAEDRARGGKVLTHVAAWYERATHHRFNVRDDADRFRVVLSPLDNPSLEIDLLDTGEGMAQVLPVLVLLGRALAGELGATPVVAIEHPELHLHPHAEQLLARLFAELATNDSIRLLVETHSQAFVRQVQLAIIEERLHPSSTCMYWIRELPDGRGIADQVTFDELARPIGPAWPAEAFNEDLEEARQVVLARRRRQ